MTTIKHIKYGVALGLAMLSMACGTASLSTSGRAATAGEASNDKAAAAVAAAFSSGGPAASISSLKSLGLKMDTAALLDATCQSAASGDMEDAISVDGYVAPGEYGAALDLLEVAEGESCTDIDGLENSGSGPDGLGLVASFDLVGEVEGTCTDDVEPYTVVMQPGSYGAWRDTVINEATGAMETHVWGRFTFLVDGTNHEVECSLQFDDDGDVLAAVCTDALGNEVEQSAAGNCQFHPEDANAEGDYDQEQGDEQNMPQPSDEQDEDEQEEIDPSEFGEEGEEGDEEEHDHDDEEEDE